LVVNINGEVISIIETTAISNPILQVPFGIWKNSSFSCFNTDNNYLYNTYFNYSNQPLNNPNCSYNYIMPASNPINSLPVSFECSIQITIPFNLLSEDILYYLAVLITKDNTSEGIGLQPSAAGEDYLIIAKDNLNFSYFLTLSSTQYRFFKQIYSINCKNQTNGLYTECGQEEFIEIEPKIV
jgi:hypothetical protein